MAAKKTDQSIEADESIALEQVSEMQRECASAAANAALAGVDDLDMELAPWLMKKSS